MEEFLVRESPFTEIEQGLDFLLCDVAEHVSAKIVDEQLVDMMIPYGTPTPPLPDCSAVGAITSAGKYISLKEPVCVCGMLFTEDSNFCRVCGIRRRDACLDGEWMDGVLKHLIRGPTIEWPNGLVTKIDVIGPGSFTTLLSDEVLTAHVDQFGKRILWSNGSVWTTGAGQAAVPTALLPEQQQHQEVPPPVVAAERPAQGRFTSRRRPRTVAEPTQATQTQPGRLAGPILGMEGDPFSCEQLAAPSSSSRSAPLPSSSRFEDLPAFRHLAALEEAVSSGAAMEGRLPRLPGFGEDQSINAGTELATRSASSNCPPPSPRSARVLRGATARVLSPRSARSAQSSGGIPLQNAGAGVLAANNTAMSSSRVLFHDGIWGLQPPSRGGTNSARGTQTLGFGVSALRGNSLSKRCRGPAATAMWVGTEGVRLRTQAPSQSKGHCAHLAFLANGGPQRIDSLSGDLL